jgi:WD40 repeat protein
MNALRRFTGRHARKLLLLASGAVLFLLWFGVWLRVLPLKPARTLILPPDQRCRDWSFTAARMVSTRQDMFGRNFGPIQVWDLTTGELLRSFLDESRSVTDSHGQSPPQLSPDGRTLACGHCTLDFSEGHRSIFNIEEGTELLRIPGEHNTLKFSPDGQYFAVQMTEKSDQDNYTASTKVYQSATVQLLLSVSDTRYWETSDEFWFSPDSKLLACLREHGESTAIYDLQAAKECALIPNAKWPLAFSPDARSVVLSSQDGNVLSIHDTRTGNRKQVLAGHLESVWGFVFREDGSAVTAFDYPPNVSSGAAMTWDTRTGSVLRTWQFNRVDPEFSLDRCILGSRREDGEHFVNLSTGREWCVGKASGIDMDYGSTDLEGRFIFVEIGREDDPATARWWNWLGNREAEDSSGPEKLRIFDLSRNRAIATIDNGGPLVFAPSNDQFLIIVNGKVDVWDLPPRRSILFALVLAAGPALLFTGLLWWRLR